MMSRREKDGRDMKEIGVAIRVTGRVQGVAYRAWAKSHADTLGLRGWIRNRDDGSVEAELAGPELAVENMIAAMNDGPAAAQVRDVWTNAIPPAAVQGPGFLIRF
jgi:acylphosphatase